MSAKRVLLLLMMVVALGGLVLGRRAFLPGTGVEVRVNERGLRGPVLPFAKPAGTRRVLYLGGAVTFGRGVARWEDTYPFVADSLLASIRAFRVETLSMAAGESTPGSAYTALAAEGLRYAPDLVVVGFVLDDVTARFPAMAVETIVHDRGDPGVKLAWDYALADLQTIVDLCAARDLPVLVVVFPHPVQLTDPSGLSAPQRVLTQYAGARAFPVFDLLPALAAHVRDSGAAPSDLFLDHNHLSLEGHRVVARILVEPVAQRLAARGN